MPRSERPVRQADRLQELERPATHRSDIAQGTGEGLAAEGSGRMPVPVEMTALDDLIGGQQPLLVGPGRIDDGAIVTTAERRSLASGTSPKGLDAPDQAVFDTRVERKVSL